MFTHDADPADLLRRSGLRVTAPRVAVLTELANRPHCDVDTLGQATRARLGSVSTQAVYDVLRVLTDHEIVRRFEPAGQPARYEVNSGDNHHHIVCRSCGSFADVECAAGKRPCLDVVTSHGYVIDEAEVLYWGTCPDCTTTSSSP